MAGADSLHDQLESVPGVASAEVRLGPDATPLEVKVRLLPDADANRVGIDVQRVLAARGMRSRLAQPAVSIPSRGSEDGEEMATVVPMSTIPPGVREAAPTAAVASEGIRSVAVEERSDGRGVVVTLDDGRIGARRRVGPGEDLDVAVVAAVADALARPIEAVTTDWSDFEGNPIVTVVVRLSGGSLTAGAAVASVGEAFAVAVAARAALDH